jgi:hypothetical protein
MFTAKDHYYHKFNKGDIVYFKMHCLARNTYGGTASLDMGRLMSIKNMNFKVAIIKPIQKLII